MPPEETTETTETTETSPLAKAAGAAQPAKPDRPDGLADDFWSEDKGVDLDKLLGSYKELSEFKTAQETAAAGRPKAAADYKLELPKDFQAPEGVKVELDPDDPRLGPARELALKLGLSQDGFAEIIALDAQFKLAEQASLDEAVAKELGKLGTKGKARVEAVETWLNANLGKDSANAITPMLFTAAQVQAIEKLIQKAGGAVPNFDPSNRETAGEHDQEVSDEEYQAMTPSQRITYSRDLAKKRQKAA